MAEEKKEAAEKESVLIALSGTSGPHYSSASPPVPTSTSREGRLSLQRRSSSRSCSKSPSSRLVNGPRATTICTVSVCSFVCSFDCSFDCSLDCSFDCSFDSSVDGSVVGWERGNEGATMG